MAQSAYRLTPERISAWLRHWLTTPPEGYIGSGYGFDGASMLMRSLSDWSADGVVRKLREDIPLLRELPAGSIAVLGEQSGPDTLLLTFVVGAAVISAELNSTTGALRATSEV